ncbi:MAG: DMT family transporter [Solirubrobacterales bacterium]
MQTILPALVAALLFALSTVLQQRVAMRATDHQARSPWFMLRLARNPVWLGGIALTWIGYGFHVAALSGGEIVVVQPILAMTMVFALPIGARLSAQPLDPRDLAAAAVAGAGLAAFLLASSPQEGIENPGPGPWLAWGGGSLAVAAILTTTGFRRSPARKAALVGTAAGVLFALHGAITKAFAEHLDKGVSGLLGDWTVWAVLIVAAISMAVSQIALQAGDLAPAIASESVVDPVVSVLLGVGLYQEAIHSSASGHLVSLLALAAMLAAVGYLALREGGALPRRT